MATNLKNQPQIQGYTKILDEVSTLVEVARRASARAINAVMTSNYWEIGKKIVLLEQRGNRRAKYGEQVIDRLSIDLTSKFGRGFSRRNIFQMRSFYLAFPSGKVQTLSAQSSNSKTFPLPWSHYVRLLSVEDKLARAFYHRRSTSRRLELPTARQANFNAVLRKNSFITK